MSLHPHIANILGAHGIFTRSHLESASQDEIEQLKFDEQQDSVDLVARTEAAWALAKAMSSSNRNQHLWDAVEAKRLAGK
jgi:hypothetical protein